MPRVIKRPSENELPEGDVRDFVELLFTLYRAARRPTLEEISRHIRDGDYPATASKETIRRMLRGTTIPAHWETVETVCHALADLAGMKPHDEITVSTEYESATGSISSLAETRWHRALDAPPPTAQPSTAPWEEDLWTADQPKYSDEPPF